MMKAAALRSSTPRRRNIAQAPSVTGRYFEFEAAHSVFFALHNRWHAAEQIEPVVADAAGNCLRPGPQFSRAWLRRFEASAAKCRTICKELIATPAASLAEIQLKLRVVSWLNCDAGYETLEELDHRMPAAIEETEAATVLANLQADLFRLTQAN